MPSSVEERKIEIGDVQINYARSGHGPSYILCLPGAIGSWQTDYRVVLENFDHEKFTIVCWDPPGFGKSRPPDRDFSHGSNARDAQKAFALMQILNLLPFSCLGWSDGGVTALNIAYQQRDTQNINKLVLWGTTSYVTKEMVMTYQGVMDTSRWSEPNRRPYVDMYGEGYFQWAWSSHLQARIDLYKNFDGNKCRDILGFVPQPVLLFHGSNDIFVSEEHPNYLLRNLRNAKFVIIQLPGMVVSSRALESNSCLFKVHVSDCLPIFPEFLKKLAQASGEAYRVWSPLIGDICVHKLF